MSDNAIGQAYTGYWEAYDLQEDPFSEADHNYTSSHWHEYLELLQHLSLYSNVMLAVAGEEDTGRSVFLNQFRTKINIHIDTHFIKADAYFDHNALLDTIVDAYNFAGIGSNSSDFSDRATSLLTNIERSEKSVLIVVENAHLLSASTLEAMLFFIKEQPADNALLHIVLFGDLELQSKLANLEQQTDSENFVHSLELELCSPEETERYLRHKVNQAGAEAVFPFSNQDVLQIHKSSEGYYRRIDRFARDLLLERASKESAAQTATHSKAKWITTSLISVAIVATGMGWYHLHQMGSSTRTEDAGSGFISQKVSGLTSTLSNTLKSWSGSSTADSSNTSTEKPTKLASLINNDSDKTMTDAAKGDTQSLVQTVEDLRKKRAEKEAVIARNEAIVKKRLEELLRESDSEEASAPVQAKPKAKTVVKKAKSSTPTQKVAKKKTTTKQVAQKKAVVKPAAKKAKAAHPATKLTQTARKIERKRIAEAKQRKQTLARIEHEKINPRDMIVAHEDAFSADDLSEYDKELARLKRAETMENPEEAAVIDKVLSIPEVKRTPVAKTTRTAQKSKPVPTLGDALTKHAETVIDVKATARQPLLSQPVPAKQLSKAERAKLIETGSFRTRGLSRRRSQPEPQRVELPKPKQVELARSEPVSESVAPAAPKSSSEAKQAAPIRLSATEKSTATPSLPPKAGMILNAEAFSLQLVGGHTRSNVEGFVKRHSLSQAHIVKSKRAGKDWYIVMYGQYQSFDQAKGAIQGLPQAVQKLNPWIRLTKDITHS